MTEGDRVKWLRKELGLTLEKFGDKLGVTKQTVSRIENGINNLTDQMSKSICREYGVCEEWLRTGEGDPFGSQTVNQSILAFANDVMADEDESFRKRVLAVLARLDPNDWEVLEKIALEFTRKDLC